MHDKKEKVLIYSSKCFNHVLELLRKDDYREENNKVIDFRGD